MKLTRLILICTLLLLASFPAFALPQCGECVSNECVYSPYSGTPCRYNSAGCCEIYFSNCSSLAPEPVLADWTVASIEVSRPALDTEIVTTPADVDEVHTTESTEQK
ncbi:MAG TPA: hypothetical protein VEK57_21060 [Thermoanaerobaculia bacterium]|nr:hypothetical protein [Thermoanaerobaculia bacterium]